MTCEQSVATTLSLHVPASPDQLMDWHHDIHPSPLDAEFTRLVQPLIRTFQDRRNAYCRWCRLPPEVLCVIFGIMKDLCGWPAVRMLEEWESDDEDGEHSILERDGALSYNPGWITVTQVCSLWREIAIGTPGLWTDPGDLLAMPRSLVPLVVQRSRDLPFSLDLQGDTHLSPPSVDIRLLDCFVPSMYLCLQELLIHRVTRRMYERVSSYLRVTLPGLRKLHVAVVLGDDGNAPQLPSELYIGPSLVELTLVDCLPSRWDFSLFGTRLSHLVLRCPRRTSSDFLPSAAQLAAILPTLSSLETLYLEDVFPDAPLNHHYPPIALPVALRSFKVRASEDAARHSACLIFLAHLTLPRDVHLDVQIRDPYDDNALGANDVRSVSALTAMAVRNIFRRQNPPRELIVEDKAFLTHNRKSEAPWRCLMNASHGLFQHSLPDITSLVTFSLETPRPDPFATTGFLAIPLCSLVSISFSSRGAAAIYNIPVWWEALGRAKGIRRLGICMDNCETLIRLAEHAMEHNGPYFPFFPDLEIIYINVQDLIAVKDSRRRHMFEAALLALLVLVHLRKSFGHKLQELVVDEFLRGWWTWNVIEADVRVSFHRFYSLGRTIRRHYTV